MARGDDYIYNYDLRLRQLFLNGFKGIYVRNFIDSVKCAAP